MSKSISSPRIERIAWGRVTVKDHGSFKDVKLFPGGARAWDWNETGTNHEPGIQPADVEELLLHGATDIILSKGMLGQLHVCPETMQLLKAKDVEAHVLETEAAVRLYNDLCATRPVGALIHSTC